MFITLHPQNLKKARKRAHLSRRWLAYKVGLQDATLALIEDLHYSILVPRQFVDRLIQQLGVAVCDITVVPGVGFAVALTEPCNTNDAPSVNGLREKIRIRDSCRCVYCGTRHDLDVDHVVPASRGGPTVEGNLVLSCRRCNNLKGDCVPTEIGMTIRSRTMDALKHWWRQHNPGAARVPRGDPKPSPVRWWCARCGTTVLTRVPGPDTLCELCERDAANG
jgi:5-methylcytosine-specific restriction endonuclease McrA